MDFEVAPLPYEKNALSPALSEHAVEVHYEKHHKGYMAKLKAAIGGTPQGRRSLEEIVQGASGTLLNNAAQVWNHTFFWESMKPGGGGAPSGRVAELFERDLGGYDGFREAFIDSGVKHFASGWVWLVVHRGMLRVVTTPNALSPIMTSTPPLLTADLWEHAYYIDYENRREAFLETFCDQLIDWDRVAARLEGVPTPGGEEFADTIVMNK